MRCSDDVGPNRIKPSYAEIFATRYRPPIGIHARLHVLRPSPSSVMKPSLTPVLKSSLSSALEPLITKPTRGELRAHVEVLSKKRRSVK